MRVGEEHVGIDSHDQGPSAEVRVGEVLAGDTLHDLDAVVTVGQVHYVTGFHDKTAGMVQSQVYC